MSTERVVPSASMNRLENCNASIPSETHRPAPRIPPPPVEPAPRPRPQRAKRHQQQQVAEQVLPRHPSQIALQVKADGAQRHEVH